MTVPPYAVYGFAWLTLLVLFLVWFYSVKLAAVKKEIGRAHV